MLHTVFSNREGKDGWYDLLEAMQMDMNEWMKCRNVCNLCDMSGRNENNYAFIDSQNLNLSILDQGWELDFARFRQYLKDKYSITKAILFMGHIAKYKPMYKRLREAGFEIVFKPTVFMNHLRQKLSLRT